MKSVDDLADELAARRARFVWPVLVASLCVYTGALVALSYADFVKARVFGNVNVAYLIAVFLCVGTFFVALAYASWARKHFDPLADELRGALERDQALNDRSEVAV